MATYRFELNAKPNRNKLHNVLLCVTIAGRRKRIKTDFYLKKKDWNSSPKGHKWVKESEPNSKVWNEALADLLEEARAKYKELKEDSESATAENVARLVKGEEHSKTFLKIEADGAMTGFAADMTKEVYDGGGIRNWKCYNGFLNKLAGFMESKKKKELLFVEITPEYLAQFHAYLKTLRNSRSKKESNKKLHPNTIAVVLKVFRALMKKAQTIGYISPDKNPFLVYTYSKVDTQKEKLDMGEIEALEALELVKGSLEWHSRNCFLFSFYCAGIRVGDLLQLRWLNVEGGRLNYQMTKTHKVRDLKIVPQAAAILDAYRSEGAKPTDFIFPFLNNRKAYADAITQADKDTLPSDLKAMMYAEESSKAALVNKTLKRVAEKAGITKPISMHISRHSFANIAKQKGIASGKLKDLLAHSSLKETEGYMGSFSTSENDQALEQVFGNDKKTQLLKLIQGMSEEDINQVLAAYSLR